MIGTSRHDETKSLASFLYLEIMGFCSSEALLVMLQYIRDKTASKLYGHARWHGGAAGANYQNY